MKSVHISNIYIRRIKRKKHGTYDHSVDSGFYTVPKGKGQLVQVSRKIFENIFGVIQKNTNLYRIKENRRISIYVELR